METPICPLMSKLVTHGQHAYRLEPQPCLGSKCAAWRPGVALHMGTCGMANDPKAFEDPAAPGKVKKVAKYAEEYARRKKRQGTAP